MCAEQDSQPQKENQMPKKLHKNKEIRAAMEYAIKKGWRYLAGGSHCQGKLYCPHAHRDGCRVEVHSTPRKPENHAKNIIAEVDDCPHQ